MEALAEALAALSAWWSGLPPIPDLDLPVPGDPDLVIVAATMVTLFGFMGLVTAWVERRFSVIAFGTFLLGCALAFWIWEVERDAITWIRIPESFVELVARVLR